MLRSLRRPAATSVDPFRASVGAVALALCAWACAPEGAASAKEPEGGMRPVEPPMVLVAAVEAREMRQVLQTTAVVESELEVAVVPRTVGETVEVLAEEGDRVAAGAVLARLESREQELARDEAAVAVRDAEQAAARAVVATKEARSKLVSLESALAQAQRDHERDLSLAATGDGRFASVSAKAVEASALALEQAEQARAQGELAVQRAELEEQAARTAIEKARLALARAEVALADRSIRAPFDGRVARRDLRVGQQATAGAPAFVLTDLDALRVVFHRPQRELGLFLAAGGPSDAPLELTATCDAWPGATFQGTLERVSPTVDAASGSFRVTARLAAEATDDRGRRVRLLPGVLVRLSLVTDRRPDALAVPKRAVQREGTEAFVLAVEDGRVRKVRVEEGYSDLDHVELRFPDGEPLAVGARVITVGSRDLEDGSAVKIADPALAPTAIADDRSAADAPSEDASDAAEDADIDVDVDVDADGEAPDETALPADDRGDAQGG